MSTDDPRRFQSSTELANAIFGSAVPTVEQRKRIEEQHAQAQVLPPPPKEEPKRAGWTPPGYRTDATAAEFAFRDMRPPSEAELQRGIAKAMRGVVGDARKQR